MGYMKKIILLIISINILFSYCIVLADDIDEEEINNMDDIIQTSVESQEEPNILSRAGIIFDRTSKKVIWGKKENDRRPMASTTKIMTAIVVLEKANLSDTVEVSKKAAGTGGSRLGLKTGDKITIHDLLYGLMMVSGNDAAVALAEHIGGSVEGFAQIMNNKAREIGLQDTNFVTPHGLDMPEHYTTAYELAKMADYGLNNKKFAQIVSTKNYTVTINGNPKDLCNTNELLGSLDGVNGVKTGFTNGANRCLVTSVKRGDMNIISVVLGADTKKIRTSDSIKLIEYAYKNYKIVDTTDLIEEKFQEWKNINQKRICINKGKTDNFNLKLEKIANSKLPVKNGENISIKIDYIEYLEAPVEKEQILGKLRVFIGDNQQFSLNILVDKEIERMNIKDYFFDLIKFYKKRMENVISFNIY